MTTTDSVAREKIHESSLLFMLEAHVKRTPFVMNMSRYLPRLDLQPMYDAAKEYQLEGTLAVARIEGDTVIMVGSKSKRQQNFDATVLLGILRLHDQESLNLRENRMVRYNLTDTPRAIETGKKFAYETLVGRRYPGKYLVKVMNDPSGKRKLKRVARMSKRANLPTFEVLKALHYLLESVE